VSRQYDAGEACHGCGLELLRLANEILNGTVSRQSKSLNNPTGNSGTWAPSIKVCCRGSQGFSPDPVAGAMIPQQPSGTVPAIDP
ncbi:hypothetical protein, partial [Pseudomonas aeruginosa]|uniref:hypothetical protein n=1 Tax=Pseudomonas aeruginosa TaxID=287 RepID=UPI001F1D073A